VILVTIIVSKVAAFDRGTATRSGVFCFPAKNTQLTDAAIIHEDWTKMYGFYTVYSVHYDVNNSCNTKECTIPYFVPTIFNIAPTCFGAIISPPSVT